MSDSRLVSFFLSLMNFSTSRSNSYFYFYNSLLYFSNFYFYYSSCRLSRNYIFFSFTLISLDFAMFAFNWASFSSWASYSEG